MKIPSKIRFLPPILIFGLTNMMVYLYVKFILGTLYINEKYIALILSWGSFSFSLGMWYWGFFRVMFFNPGIPSKEMEQYHGKRLPRCIHCKQYKPYRTHHCSSCKCCYAKLDHHCNALGRCIALRNHKPFLVFLIHSVSMLAIWFLTVCYMLLAIKNDDSPRFLHFHFYASISLTILIAFLLFEQIGNVLSGKTTLELIYNIPMEIKKTKFELFEEVMGPFNIGWLIPTETPSSTSAFQWEDLRPLSEQIPQPKADENKVKMSASSNYEGNTKGEGKIERE